MIGLIRFRNLQMCCGLFLLLLLVCGAISCGSVKRTTTTTTTESVIKVDTVIQVKTDTVIKYERVPIYDTAYIENKQAVARSYYSPGDKKIVLSLKLKPLSVPVTISQKKIETVQTKIKEVKQRSRIPIIICVTLLLAFYGFLFISRKKDGTKIL
jgi:hypothetical protein